MKKLWLYIYIYVYVYVYGYIILSYKKNEILPSEAI